MYILTIWGKNIWNFYRITEYAVPFNGTKIFWKIFELYKSELQKETFFQSRGCMFFKPRINKTRLQLALL